MKEKSQYEMLGIDPHKNAVRKAFAGVIDNEFPGAWTNIVTLPFCSDMVATLHGDGDGSKIVQRILQYFYCKENKGDPTVFFDLVDDALGMNAGDVAASGFVYLWHVIDLLNIAKYLII